MEQFLLAACQIDCGPDSRPSENFEKIMACAKDAATKGARLVLFPELCLSGYSIDPADIESRMLEVKPRFFEELHKMARRLKLALTVGFFQPARDSEKVHNVAMTIAPDGREFRYQKLHVPPNEASFRPGESGMNVADLGFVKLGMAICFDNWFAETARMAYLAGAELLHMPFVWPAEWEVKDDIPSKRTPLDDEAILRSRRERIMKVFPARALDNGLYLVMLDQAHRGGAGSRMAELPRMIPGKSVIFDPYGELVGETKGWEEETLYVEIKPDRLDEWRNNPFFPGKHLRPDIYIEAYKQFLEE